MKEIFTRRSVRLFSKKRMLNRKKIDLMLRAAMQALVRLINNPGVF